MSRELYHLLFIDDDKDFLQSMNFTMSSQLIAESNNVEMVPHFISDPKQAITFTKELEAEQEKIAVIISDQQMPEMTGIELIEEANKVAPNAIKVLLTGHASLESAKYAINHKILDQYVSKPIEDYDNFASLIKNAVKTFHFREEKERAEEEIKRYVRELEEKNEKIKSMHSTAERIAYLAQGFKKLDLDEVLDLIITKIPEVFKAKYASLFILNEEDKTLHMARSNYLDESYRKPLDINDHSPMSVALRENKTIVVPEMGDVSYDFLQKDCLGRSFIIIPFVIGDRNPEDILDGYEGIRGVLNLGNIAVIGNVDIIRYAASLIRNILGINILNARLYQKTQKLALIDGLTGLYNKHIFMEFLKKECDYSERHRVPFFLCLMDVDDFKIINDTHGHRMGDKVLTRLGALLRRAARKSDIVARFGGEEFVMLIHGDELDDITAFLERSRLEVCKCEFPGSINLSISLGLSTYHPGQNDSPEHLIDRADSALYKAKGKGKNRVEISLEDREYEHVQK